MPPSQGRPDLPAVLAILFVLTTATGGLAHAQTAPVGDRYSGEIYVRPSFQAPSPTSGPVLGWPAKTSATALQPAAPSPPAKPASAYPPVVRDAPAQQARVYAAPPVMPWYQRYGAGPAPASAAAPRPSAPQSVYDPPTAPVAAANEGETARFYSLHRPYGLTPDPDPIPPQAFTQTADFSQPSGSDGAASNLSRP
jgi:hypothetical protein